MSCEQCMYISGHSSECPTGLADKVSDLESTIADLASLVRELQARVNVLEGRPEFDGMS